MANVDVKQKNDLDRLRQTVEAVSYSEEELAYRSRLIDELTLAKDQRSQSYTELDDMTYDEYYEANKKAAAGYIPPKKNKEDVRTVTGVTREKTTTLLSSLLDYDFEPDVEAYNEDSVPDRDMSDVAEDLIRKSRKLEMPDYDVKKILIYKELCDQGTVFVMERFCEYERVRKVVKNMDVTDLNKLKWDTKNEKLDQYCDAELVSGMNVYLGDIRQFHMAKQPFVGVRFNRTRSEAYARYGAWQRWKNVPYTTTGLIDDNGSGYSDWSLCEVKQNRVEEILYFNPWRNEFNILLNGVMMLPVGFPLEHLTGTCEYPLAKGDAEPISPDFAYSRSIPSKTKVNQALMDEMYKMMVVKTRKSYKPPVANQTGQRLSDKIFMSGTIINDVDPEKIKPIGDNNGVTSSEFNMIEFVKRVIDDSSVAPVFEGNSSKGNQTAKEISTLEKQTVMKLGLIVLGIMNLEKQMAWLRLCNIINHWTEPVDKRVKQLQDGTMEVENVYRTETTDTTLEDGEKGKRIISFKEGDLPESQQVEAEEDLMSKRQGQKIRINYIDPIKFKEMKYRFYIEIVASERTTGELRKAMFEETAIKMLQMFPESTNKEYLQTQIARNNKMDPDKLIMKQQAPQPMPEEGGMGQVASQMMPKKEQSPSLNTLISG